MSADPPTRTLQDALASVRSKNAGPFTVTFDLFFSDRETFLDVIEQQVLAQIIDGRKQTRVVELLGDLKGVAQLIPGDESGDKGTLHAAFLYHRSRKRVVYQLVREAA